MNIPVQNKFKTEEYVHFIKDMGGTVSIDRNPDFETIQKIKEKIRITNKLCGKKLGNFN